jgi:nucleoside-diphosphate-sugar epimerase
MRVFVTGATGFIGSFIVRELLAAGHEVLGLSRSDAGAEALERAGAEVIRADVNDLERVGAAANSSDGVIHAAFNHDSPDARQPSEDDRRVITALGAALAGPDIPFVVTSGTGLVASTTGAPVVEADPHATSAVFPRAASEEAAEVLMAEGKRVMVMRLPQVHDTRRQGRLSWHVQVAQERGRVAYIGDGQNRVPAVHVADAARAYRLVLEKGRAGARYHAVAEEGVSLRSIAEAIGARLELPVESISADEAEGYFGWLAQLAGLDLPASGAATQQALGWTPVGPDVLSDLRDASGEQ